MSVGGLETAVRQNNQLIDNARQNIEGIQTGRNSVKGTVVGGSNGVSELTFKRAEDIQLFNTVLVSSAQSGRIDEINSYSAQIAAKIGDPKSKDYLGTVFANLISGLNVANPAAPGAKQDAFAKTNDFCHSIQSYARGLEDTKRDLEENFSSTFKLVGEKLAELSSINKSMTGGDFTRQARRDAVLEQLSEHINIKADINPTTGVVLISVNTGTKSVPILTPTKYATFNYAESSDINSSTQKVIIQYVNSNSNTGTTETFDLNKAIGGQIGGLVEARTNLSKAMKNIDSAVVNIADQINKMHNLGSGYPPLSTLTSESNVALTDKAIYTGRMLIGVTDNTGRPVNSLLRPLDLNFDTMLKRSGTSVLTVDEVVREINAEAACDGRAGVGIGAGVYGDPNTCLINNMSLVTGDIDATGKVGVQFRLSSGAPIDTTFEILEARVTNAGGAVVAGAVTPPAQLPSPMFSPFLLKAGETAKTNQNMALSFANGGAEAQASLWVRVRAVGVGVNSEGTSQEAWVRYDFGAPGGPALSGQTLWNSRIQGNAAPGAVAGGPGGIPLAPVTAAKVGGPQINAAVVDGKLEIRSMGTTTGLVLIDPASSVKISKVGASATDLPEAFSKHFNLRNLLGFDSAHPALTIAVSDSNPDNLALTLPTLVATAPRSVPVPGLAKASANFTFAPGGNAANNETVTVNGLQFTFRAPALPVPAANTDILVGADGAATIKNLLAVLQAHPSTVINPLLEFSINPANQNQLVATAKYAGTKGNAITVDSVVGGGNVWTNAAAAITNNLQNGTNQPAGTTGVVQAFDGTYEVSMNLGGTFKALNGSVEINVNGTITSMSIEKFFNDFLEKIRHEAAANKEDKEVAEKVTSKLKAALKAETVFDKNALLLEAVKLSNMNKFIYEMIRLIMQNQLGVLRINGGG